MCVRSLACCAVDIRNTQSKQAWSAVCSHSRRGLFPVTSDLRLHVKPAAAVSPLLIKRNGGSGKVRLRRCQGRICSQASLSDSDHLMLESSEAAALATQYGRVHDNPLHSHHVGRRAYAAIPTADAIKYLEAAIMFRITVNVNINAQICLFRNIFLPFSL